MKSAKYLAQNLMPYGGPSQMREGWKEQLKAFSITFGASAIIGLFAGFVGGEDEKIFPNLDERSETKLEILIESVEDILQSKGSEGKLGAPSSLKVNPQELIGDNPIPMSEIEIDVPMDLDDPTLNEAIDKVNNIFVELEQSSQDTGQDSLEPIDGMGNGISNGSPNGKGSGNGSGDSKSEGNGGIDYGDPSKLSEEVFINYEKFPEFDYKQLLNAINYPAIARKSGKEDKVIVRVLIDQSGNVVKKEVMEGSSIFHQSALDAISKVKFSPAVYNGRNAPAWLRIPIVYKLQ